MKKNDTVEVKRHSLLFRILHWVIVLQVLVLMVTGLSLSSYFSFDVLERGVARNLHIALAMIWTGTIAFFMYYFIFSGEYRWFGLSRLAKAFDFYAHEVGAFLRVKKIRNPILYDVDRKAYREKVVLTEVLAWWSWLLLWCAMIFTGLALLFPGSFELVNNICLFVLPFLGKATVATRFVHLAVCIFMFLFTIIHVYGAWSFGMIGAMFTGMAREQVADTRR